MPLFDAILRLFRRPAKSGRQLAAETQAKIDDKIRAEREALERLIGKLEPATDDAKPDLALLLANGRASAERQQQILGDPTAPPAKPQPTKFTARCQWCLEPFEREPRSLGEIEKLRQVLFISVPQAMEPIDICDGCYESVVGSAIPVNGHTGLLDIGGDNHGPGNVLLRTFGKPAA